MNYLRSSTKKGCLSGVIQSLDITLLHV